MDEARSSSKEDLAVRNVVESWAAAVRHRDYEGILKNHSSDVVMFDVPPPFQSRGIEAYKKTWDLFFSCSGGPVVFDPSVDTTNEPGKRLGVDILESSQMGLSSSMRVPPISVNVYEYEVENA
jgi:hypothetical protein